MKKIRKIFKITFPYICVIFAAFLFSYAIRAFANKGGLLTSGLSGIALVIARYIGMIKYDIPLNELMNSVEVINYVNLITSIVFFVGNIPLIYLAFKKLGKQFAILSTVFIVFNTIFIRLLPESIMNIFVIQNDSGLASAVFAGVFCGAAVSLTLKMGGSPGGSEIITTYLSRLKQISVGKLSMLINACVIIVGGLVLGEWTLILFTLVLVFVSGSVIDVLHRVTIKKTIYVITENHLMISKSISNSTKYSSTFWAAHGGYSGNQRHVVMTIVPENVVEQIISIVEEADPGAFIVVIETSNVRGNFYIEPLK